MRLITFLFSKTKVQLAAMCLGCITLLSSCSTDIPKGMTAVSPFDIQRYTGTWYEIARLDHSFERGLTNVSATYNLQTDSSVQVINRGYDPVKKAFKEAKGKAVFTGDSNTGSLKVSFFGPFYGGYHVIALDQADYRWAMIAGPDTDYLWILSRDKQLSSDTKWALISQAKKLGFDTEKLIWVEQTDRAQ
jgi:apolipoprotein D and lipocalin family protein